MSVARTVQLCYTQHNTQQALMQCRVPSYNVKPVQHVQNAQCVQDAECMYNPQRTQYARNVLDAFDMYKMSDMCSNLPWRRL